MEQIENFEAEVTLLYANIKNIELMLKQVTYIFNLKVLYLIEEVFSIIF